MHFWIQHVLGDFGSINMCRRIYKDETSTSFDIPFYKISTFGGTADVFIEENQYNEYKRKYNYPGEGDILISAAGTLGRTVRYNGEDAYFQDSNIVWLSLDNNKITNDFLYYIYETIRWDDAEGSTIKRLYNKDITDKKVITPTLKEQDKIESILKKIDSIITLEQEKLVDYIRIQRLLLSKLFPDNGKAEPALRFKSFNDSWIQHELQKVAPITMGQSPSSKNYTNDANDHILVQGNADLKEGKVSPRIWTTEVTKTADPGDIILTVRAPVGDVALNEDKVVLGRGVSGIKGTYFVYQLLKRMNMKKYWKRYSTGSTFESINSTDIKTALVVIPREAEQEKVGNILKKIDNIITLEQNRIEYFTNMKIFLLQNLFV